MKVTTNETLYMKNMVLLWSTSVEKDSNIVPLFFWAFLFFGLSLFLFGLSFFGLSFFSFLRDNALIMIIIILLFIYNSKLEQDMTLYECLRWCTGMGNESRVTCIKNYAWWLFHKYDVNYMIMQGNMSTMMRVMINVTVESCMAIYLGVATEMP